MTDYIEDRSHDPFVVIDNRLLAMPLTTEAFRVYVQLKKYANNEGKCFPSYSRLGKECFRGSYPEGGESTLRKKAIASVKELVDLGVLVKESRVYGDTEASASNLYILTHPRQWRSESSSLSPLAHPKRIKKTSEGGSPVELGGSPVELPEGGSSVELGGSSVELGGSNVEPITISKELRSKELNPLTREAIANSKPGTAEIVPLTSGFADERIAPETLASLTNKPGFTQQTDKSSSGSIVPAAFDNLEQSNKPKYRPDGREAFPWEVIDPVKGWTVEAGFASYVSNIVKDYSNFKDYTIKRFAREVINYINRAHYEAERRGKLLGYWQDYQEGDEGASMTVTEAVNDISRSREVDRIRKALEQGEFRL